METWDAIRSRRNVRNFNTRPIQDADLDQILEAARRTPSSMNEQRWDFVVVTDRDELGALSKVWRNAKHVAASAATIALVAPTVDDIDTAKSVHYDLGQATMSIMIAAAGLRIGSAHAAVSDQALARELLNLPEDRELAWLVALGYPADRGLSPIEQPKRRAFEDVVHHGTWQD